MKRFSLAVTWLAVACLVTMVSCRKPVVGFSGDGRAVTISAVTESGNGSKTAIEGLKVNWSEGDVISMNGCELTLKEGAGTTEGVFEGTVTGEGPYYVGYPKEYISYVADPLSFSINIPPTMTYDTEKQIVPMVAVTNSVEGGLQFHNAVNVLKMQLKGDGTEVSKLKSIVLTSATSNLSGKISVTFDGGTPEFAAIADGAKKMTVSFGTGLQLTDVAKCVYIPLAKIDGGDLTVRFNCANGKYMEKTIKVDSYATAFNGVNNVLDIETEVEVEGEIEPIGFTVNSEGKKVEFAKGNLVATINASGKPTAWKFATNQYDCLRKGGANETIGTKEGDIDLFCWSTDATYNNWGIYTQDAATTDYTTGEFNDWGIAYCKSNNIQEGTWYTLSEGEWDHLLNKRTAAATNRFAKAKLNGVQGIVIFPDGYNGNVLIPNNSITGISQVNSTTTGYPTSNIAKWSDMESAGVIFLPAGYNRKGKAIEEQAVTYIRGRYWSSTKNNADNAYYLSFDKNNLSVPQNIRHRGFSVRLVRDVE